MANDFSIAALREQIARDTEVLKLEKARFYRLQDQKLEDLTPADRKSIINWSRSSISDYAAQLDRMEEIVNPTPEEKQVMMILNQLVMLGDQIADFTRAFVRRLEEAFPHVEDAPLAKDSGAPKMPVVEGPAKEATAVFAPPEPEIGASRDSDSSDEQHLARAKLASSESARTDFIDPNADLSDRKGIYKLLGVPHDAPMAQIKRAIKVKSFQLHPDRNPDPNASKQFAEFQALCKETVETEEKREEYDSIKTQAQLENVTKKVQALTTGTDVKT